MPSDQAAINISGGSTNPNLDGFNIKGGYHSLSLGTGASGTFTNNTFIDALNFGISLDTTGVVTMDNNMILNNKGGGINVTNSGVNSVFKHNLIRGNTGVDGGGVYIASTKNPQFQNNLIIQNTATTSGGGIAVTANGTATLLHNTIAENISAPAASGGGINIMAGSTVVLTDNIIYGNLAGVISNDLKIDATAALTEDYNLTGDGSLTNTFDVTGNPTFSDNWYLNQASSSLTVSSGSANADTFSYLTELGTPTTNITGGTDTGTVDMGYHHSTTSTSVDTVNSTVTATLTQVVLGSTSTITITPKDSTGATLGTGLDVHPQLNALSQSSLSVIRDNGNETYEVIFTAGVIYPNPDIITITVNGVTLDQQVTITWPQL